MSFIANSLLILDSASSPHISRSIYNLLHNSTLDSIAWAAIRVVLVGAVVAGLRKAAIHIYARAERALYPTAFISAADNGYLWVMAWIAQDPYAQAQIRDFQLSTSEWRQIRRDPMKEVKSGDATAGPPFSCFLVAEHNASWTSKDIIGQMLPTYKHEICIKHNGETIWVTRWMGFFARMTYRNVDHIRVRTTIFQPNAIKNFLVAAHAQFHAKTDKEVLIFNPQRINALWQKPISRPVRPWSSVILPGTTKDDLLEDIEQFLSEKEKSWYAARGIPHRRGYLFHGEPGAGKTTLATAIASKLRLDIYVINPAQRGMDDAKLSKLFRDCPARSFILIEDIDCVFPKRRGRSSNIEDQDEGDDNASEVEQDIAPAVTGSTAQPPSTVTLSGLLNAIDGVSSQEGCILIASTNHPKRLDPALSRAGRFDVQVPFFSATPEQAHALFLYFFPYEDFADDGIVMEEKRRITSRQDIEDLATEFVKIVFPSIETANRGKSKALKLSMATLQGYLLRHKDTPWTAVEGARGWIRILEGGMPTLADKTVKA